ncbi:uncharacterized protein LOC110989114 [Acanthaster planci]|uniref:Uncharacterized protein LOC110989114 n=1 Tax=Acanthaster planci TaxID=133434 RepID=A0A8B7ZZD9_ACAPL|nr:uncharacterized protein LOC110989114 [Acanthaster planci]
MRFQYTGINMLVTFRAAVSTVLCVALVNSVRDACKVCKCSSHGPLIVNCTRKGLTELPSRIPNETRVLILDGNFIRFIPYRGLLGLKSLVVLQLTNNSIKAPFEIPKSVVKLSANWNGLQDIRPIMRNGVNLDFADFSNNALKVIQTDTFKNCTKMLTLSLGLNNISTVQHAGLSGPKYLNNVRLQGNNLEDIGPSATAGLHCRSLWMYKTKLRHIQPHTLAGVKRPNLSYNMLKDIPSAVFADPAAPTPRNLLEVNFRKNLINHISERAFQGVRTITVLTLQGNKLSSLPEHLFANTTISLTLNLASNQLTTMPDGLLRSQSMLKHLYLQQNRLTVLNEHMFKGLRSLTDLMLFDNPLIEVADWAFYETQLTRVYIFQTNLTVLGRRPFATVNDTIKLMSLYGNYFETLPDALWQDLATNCYVSVDNTLKFAPSTNRTDIEIELVRDGFAQPINLTKDDGKMLTKTGFECYPLHNTDIWQCKPCPQGFFGASWSGVCIACPPGGFFQNQTGQLVKGGQVMNCHKCNNGTFVAPSAQPGKRPADCKVCPTGTIKSLHAGFRACPCVDNYYRTDRFGECYPCPTEGLNCTEEYQHLLPGFWWTWNWGSDGNRRSYEQFVQNLRTENASYDSFSQVFLGTLPRVHACPRPESCAVEGYGIRVTCQTGYEGWLCSRCSKGYYARLDNCLECPKWQWFLLEAMAVLLVVAVLIVVIVWDLRRNRRSGRSVVDKLLARAKILLGFYQVIGEIFSALEEIQWPDLLKSFGSVLHFLEVDVMRIVISPRCYFPDFTYPDVYIEFIFGFAFVAVVFCAALCFYGVTKCYHVAKETPVLDMTLALTKARQRCYLFVVMLLFVSYPSLSSVILTLLPSSCDLFYLDEHHMFNATRLRFDYSIDCKTSRHVHFTHAAEVSLSYVIGFPLLLFVLLWWSSGPWRILRRFAFMLCGCENGNASSDCNMACEEQSLPFLQGWEGVRNRRGINASNGQSDLDGRTTRRQSDQTVEHTTTGQHNTEGVTWKTFLCENYKPQFWYWEIIELVRKIVQTVFVLLFGYEDPFTMLATIVTSVVFLLIHSSVRPMKDDSEHRLQLFSLGTIFLNLLVASLLLLPANEDPSSEKRKEVLAVTLVLLNLSLIAFVLFSFMWSCAKAVWRQGCCGGVGARITELCRQRSRPAASRCDHEGDEDDDELQSYAEIQYSDIANAS